jgi:hypothetical protein
MRKLWIVTAALSCLVALPGAASAKSDTQLWTGVGATVPLGSKWLFSQEVITRFSDKRNGLYEVESVSALNYKISPKVTIAAGYVHNPQYAAGDFTQMERRAREQVTFNDIAKLGGGSLSARLRLEQRWRDHVDGTAWRARPYVKYALPLHKTTALVLSSELFVNLKRAPFQRVQGIDRMRNFAGVSFPLSKQLGLEAGYLNQTTFVRGGADQMDHVASTTLSIKF